ncbi:MAG: molecular chaperone DnaK, partial [Pseudomonadota bacterium]
LKEYGDKVSEGDRSAITDAIAALKAAVEAEEADAEDITAKSQTLMEVSMKLGQAIYEQSQTDAGDGDGESDEKVVDADFEEVKDDDEQKSA